MVVGIILIFACLMIEILIQYIGYDFKLTILISISMATVELSSIAENFEVITGKNFISLIIKFIVKNIKKIIENKIGKDENENGR